MRKKNTTTVAVIVSLTIGSLLAILGVSLIIFSARYGAPAFGLAAGVFIAGVSVILASSALILLHSIVLFFSPPSPT